MTSFSLLVLYLVLHRGFHLARNKTNKQKTRYYHSSVSVRCLQTQTSPAEPEAPRTTAESVPLPPLEAGKAVKAQPQKEWGLPVQKLNAMIEARDYVG